MLVLTTEDATGQPENPVEALRKFCGLDRRPGDRIRLELKLMLYLEHDCLKAERLLLF